MKQDPEGLIGQKPCKTNRFSQNFDWWSILFLATRVCQYVLITQAIHT